MSIISAFRPRPSGEPEPSRDDIFLTYRLKEAGRILCIELLDHVIIGGGNYFSLREKGLIKGKEKREKKSEKAKQIGQQLLVVIRVIRG